MQRMVLTLAVVLLSSCYNYDADEFDQSNPKTEDLVGTYKLASQSLTQTGSLSIFGDSPCEIILNSDGTFEGVSVPAADPATDSDAEFHTTEFIKKLVRENGKWAHLGGQAAIEFSSSDSLHHLFTAMITKPNPDRGLLIYIGDEDSGNALYLKRIKNRD